MRALTLPVALLIAALVVIGTPANLKNSTLRPNKQAVQAEVPRKEPTAIRQEKAPTEQQAVVEPEAVRVEAPVPQTPLTDHEQWMQAAGISPADWIAVDYIISHESGWRPTVANSEGCVGLGQRCPASLLLADCPDLDPVCQLKAFSKYAVNRYGSWQGAYSAWASQRWW